MTKVRMTVTDTEQSLVKKARELTKLETKRAEAVKSEATRQVEAATKVAAIDADIARVRGEISALVSPASAQA